MSLYVLKFGGSSVATTARIENAATIITDLYALGHRLVVVVSAMQGVTNQLVDLAKNFSESGCSREYDVVISSGEQVSSGLLALCLQKKGINAKSFQGWQLPIVTEAFFGEADIKFIKTDKIYDSLNSDIIPIIAGFQGVSEGGDITTIGRGGSDASAVALARFLQADECFIYTDVDGVYTADPRTVLSAKKLASVSYPEMLALSTNGAKVLQDRSVQISQEQFVKLRVLSSFSSDGFGTVINNNTEYLSKIGNIAGIAHNTSVVCVKLNDKVLSYLFEKNIGFINMNNKHLVINKTHYGEIKQISSVADTDIGIISIIGENIINLEETILDIISNINIKSKSISDLSLSLVLPFQQIETTVNILHDFLF